ncbi:MAG: MerR family transcriptional regulator [Promethearchaeota archaeon]|nr:MAG: MerR family transcriptional regulator [Candidatus Lokiarchaeota archaeon]
MLLSISQAAKILGVCCKTLRRWHARGILCPDCRTPGGHRRYGLQTLDTFLHTDLAPTGRRQKMPVEPTHFNQFRCAAIYARVSALKQKADLTRQITSFNGRVIVSLELLRWFRFLKKICLALSYYPHILCLYYLIFRR